MSDPAAHDVRPIRLGFGVTVLAKGLAGNGIDGIGTYTGELYRRLSLSPGLAVKAYGYNTQASAPGIDAINGVGGFGSQAVAALLTGRSFPGFRDLARSGIDLVHATDHLVPRLHDVPVIATLMDAIPLSHPQWVAYRFRWLKNRLWRKSMRWADRIITISEYSRGEIVHWFGIPSEHIDVIPLGVDARWYSTPSIVEAKRARATWQLPERYFLFVGTLQPRKNLARVLAAHRQLPAALRRDHPLVVVGRAGWGCDDLVKTLQSADPKAVRWLQHLPDRDLLGVVHQAHALVFPSLCEGLGLPVLESFAAGTPVITSNTTALPEVAQDAALLVDPTDTGAISDAMCRLAEDAALAAQLRQKGSQRARDFSWERTAEMTLGSYRRLLAGD